MHAWSLLQNGQFETAKLVSRELCKSHKRDAESWYLLSLALSQLQEYSAAIKAYQKTLELSPNLAAAAFNLALTLQLSGRLTDAVRHYRKAIKLDPAMSDAHYNLGNTLLVLEQYRQAGECYKTVIAQRPDYPDARINLAIVLQKLGDYSSAERMLRSVAQKYRSAAAYMNLGQLYQSTNDQQRAIDCYLKALELKPHFPTAQLRLGGLYETLGRYDLALQAYHSAAVQEPNQTEAIYGIASVYFQTGCFENAKKYLKETLTLDPRHAKSYVSWGSIQVIQGDLGAALTSIDKALAIDSAYTDAIVLKAKIHEQRGEAESALRLLQPLIEAGTANAAAGSVYANILHGRKEYRQGIQSLESILRNAQHHNWGLRQIHFSLGKLYDAAGDYDAAFSHYRRGNELRDCNYASARQTADVEALIGTFTPDYSAKLARSSIHSLKPVFIVGMPRSGTSLVEQILSCHPDVAAGGELTFVHDVARTLKDRISTDKSYPECLVDLTAEIVDSIVEDYVRMAASFRKDQAIVTDKLPLNFIHLGLISLLFPEARIVHCRRNPIDTCLSCYFQDFSGHLPFTYNLEHLAHYYREYRRLMVHWQRVLVIPVLTIGYEDLIRNQEAESRKIIEFCGLEWDPRCLDFNKVNRFVRTASYDQVRRPIYRSSVNRWKNYEAYVGPLKKLQEE
jgi:tetratricopeptide (TPR) repeat protein